MNKDTQQKMVKIFDRVNSEIFQELQNKGFMPENGQPIVQKDLKINSYKLKSQNQIFGLVITISLRYPAIQIEKTTALSDTPRFTIRIEIVASGGKPIYLLEYKDMMYASLTTVLNTKEYLRKITEIFEH